MADSAVVKSPYIPRDQFLDFHAREQRFATMVVHRRGGKTVACIGDLIDKAVQNEESMPHYSYIAPLYKQAKNVAWSYLKFYAKPLIDKVMESELSVILKGGQTIRLYGADNPDSLRGIYNDGVILDEYGDMQPRLFGEVISPTLVDRKGWCAFIGTPKGPNHFKELVDSAQGNPDWFVKILKASESGIIDDDELALQRNMPGSDEDTYRQEFECDFYAAIRGSYYGKLLNELETTNCGSYPWDRNLQVLTSWDIGYSDDTSVWFYQTNGSEYKMIDFFTVSGYSVNDVLGELKNRPYEYGMMYLPHDAKNKSFQTGKSTRELMLAAGCKVQIVPNLSIQDGIQAVRETLPQVYFNTDNEQIVLGLNALRMYQREWDDTRRVYKEAPKHDWSSNPADSFRMFALAMNKGANRRGSQSLFSGKVVPIVSARKMTLENLWDDRKHLERNTRI